MTILDVKNLSAGYGNGFVIHGATFSLEKGEFVSILGRNGSGKSTLIKALQGLLKNASGRVTVAGADLFRMNPAEIARKIAYVPQIFDTAFEFSVLETVAMGRYLHQGRLSGMSRADRLVIEDVMALTRVSHLRDKKTAHLSGGERQRVYIARALAQDSPILFLDEPSSHLDINFQVEIYQILKRLQIERAKTILCTEHNINLAVPYSQRIIFLREGRIQAMGRPETLITRSRIKEVFDAEVEIRENIHTGLPEISLIPRLPEGREQE